MSTKKRTPKKDLTKPYEPTPRERAAREAFLAKKKEAAPRLKVEGGKIAFDHPDDKFGIPRFAESLGSTDFDFMGGMILQLANAGSQGENQDGGDEIRVNFMLSVIREVEPRDQLESMLAAQMAAVHMATMTFARRLAGVETIDQQDSAERAFNKLARTFTAQMEALKRYRTGGEQTVRVEHVTVNEGGQAIVGNVTRGGRGDHDKPEVTP